MRYSSPRHLPDPPPHERAALTGQPLLIAVTIVIGGLLATALTRHGDSAETDTAAPPETTGAPPSLPPPTASAPAAKPAPGEPTPSSPASGSSAVGGGNLLDNPGFEDDLNEMDKTMPMCDLPFTGTRGGTPLFLGGGGLVVLGTLALVLATRRARKQDSAGERAA
jgi:hypothetical protein